MDVGGRRRPDWAVLALVGSGLLVVLGWWGARNPGRYVVVDGLFDHVFVLGVAAALLAGSGLALLARGRWWRAVWLGSATVVALLWAGFGLTLGSLGDDGPIVARAPSPGGDLSAVVRLVGLDAPDPAVTVVVRQVRGLSSRERPVGCISADDPAYTFRAVRWVDRSHVEVRTARHRAVVRVDPHTGRPDPGRGGLWSC